MPRLNRTAVLDAVTLSDAANSKASTMERRLHDVLRAEYGEDGTMISRRWIRPGPDCTVISELVDVHPAKPSEPELDLGSD